MRCQTIWVALPQEWGSEVLLLVVLLKILTIVDANSVLVDLKCILMDYACKISKGKETKSKVRGASTQLVGIASI